jgi:hypothetical protein
MLLDDVTPSEIAVALNVPPATVGRRVNDILGRLCAEPPSTADVPCDRRPGCTVCGREVRRSTHGEPSTRR